jgi:hypothetical protein
MQLFEDVRRELRRVEEVKEALTELDECENANASS